MGLGYITPKHSRNVPRKSDSGGAKGPGNQKLRNFVPLRPEGDNTEQTIANTIAKPCALRDQNTSSTQVQRRRPLGPGQQPPACDEADHHHGRELRDEAGGAVVPEKAAQEVGECEGDRKRPPGPSKVEEQSLRSALNSTRNLILCDMPYFWNFLFHHKRHLGSPFTAPLKSWLPSMIKK